MEKKGFTLVELLAVIVILAVIALISTPMIINVIEGSKKGALKDSAYGLLEATDIYYAEHTIDGINRKTEFIFDEGKQTSIEQLGYKGYVEKGSMYLYSDGKVALCISDGKYAAIKNVDEEEVRMSSGRCSYNEATEEYETVGICSDLESELEKVKEENNKKIEEIRNEYEERISNLTNDYEEQKKTIENTYKDQIEELNRRIEELEANKEADIAQIRAEYEDRIKTQKEAYEAQINELNRQLNIFKTGGTASASDIASGKTAYVNGELITGILENTNEPQLVFYSYRTRGILFTSKYINDDYFSYEVTGSAGSMTSIKYTAKKKCKVLVISCVNGSSDMDIQIREFDVGDQTSTTDSQTYYTFSYFMGFII